MATPERDNGTVIVEQKSSIEITRNAKAESQYKVKVVAGESDDVLTTMRQQAVEQYKRIGEDLAGGRA